MAETLGLPQDSAPGHVPARGDSLTLIDNTKEQPPFHVTLLLHDPALDVWCARDETSGELRFIRLDAELNWQQVEIDVTHGP